MGYQNIKQMTHKSRRPLDQKILVKVAARIIMVGKLENTIHSTLTQHGGLIMVQRCSLQIVNKMTIIKWVLCIRKYLAKIYGNVKPPVPAVKSVGAAGGLMATNSKDSVIVISPDQTYTIVDVFPPPH